MGPEDTRGFPSKIVRSWEEMENAIAELGNPPNGFRRVFRGQTKEYKNIESGKPRLLPALARSEKPSNYDPAWLSAVVSYAFPETSNVRNLYVWGPALVQHYGPGSPFLDVTSDPRVALWFAVHEHHQRWIHQKLFTDREGKNLEEHSYCSAWYTPLKSPCSVLRAVIYIFDVEPWDGLDIGPSHGQLVDLLAQPAPDVLAKEAARIRSQQASLIFADLKNPGGPDLGPMIRASITVGGDFDFTTLRLGAISAKMLFPGPQFDPIYKKLIRVPAELKVGQSYFQHPLRIPFYLTIEPFFWESNGVHILDGTGEQTSPARFVPSDSALSSRSHRELTGFLQMSRRVSRIHSHLVASVRDQVVGKGRMQIFEEVFDLTEATPILLETPLWSWTPSVETPFQRGCWIDSALPLGIADTIENRRTTNVYVELSALDYIPPGAEGLSPFCPRAVWLARSRLHYSLVLFQVELNQSPEGCSIIQAQFDFRYDQEVGRFFGRYPGAKGKWTILGLDLDAEHVWKPALKALFTTLTLLRDLSPGLKPPALHAQHIEHKNKSTYYQPPYELEAQQGTLLNFPSTSYVVPRALDGTSYLHRRLPALVSPGEELRALDSFFDHVKDPYYRVYAAVRLTDLCSEYGRHEREEEVLGHALRAAQSVKVPHVEVGLEIRRGLLLAGKGKVEEADTVLRRALAISQAPGCEQARALCEKVLAKKLVPVTARSKN